MNTILHLMTINYLIVDMKYYFVQESLNHLKMGILV